MKLPVLVAILGSLGFGEAHLRSLLTAPSWPNVKCNQNVTVTNNGPANFITPMFPFIYPPVEILQANGSNVLFSFSQTLGDVALTTVAVDYNDASRGGGLVCDVQRNVLPGEVGVYNATCNNGTAKVTVYAQAPMFAPKGYGDGVPVRCSRFPFSYEESIIFAIFIPCRAVPDCIYSKEAPFCENDNPMVLAGPETFDDGKVDGWLFGAPGAKSSRRFMDPGSETAMTFAIPAPAVNAIVSFKIIELARYSELRVRVNNTQLVLNATYDCEAQDPSVDFSVGDISFKSVPIGNKMDQVTLTIPSRWFAVTRRLTIGISGTVGVDDFLLTADCRVKPPIECSRRFEYLHGSPTDFIQTPLDLTAYRYLANDNTTLGVVVDVTQNLSPKLLRHVAVDYAASDGMRCEVFSGMPPVRIGDYEVQCENGTSIFTLYFQDDSLNGTNMATSDFALASVPDRCCPLTGGSKTRAYVFKVYCQVPGFCPSPKRIFNRTAWEIAYYLKLNGIITDDGGD